MTGTPNPEDIIDELEDLLDTLKGDAKITARRKLNKTKRAMILAEHASLVAGIAAYPQLTRLKALTEAAKDANDAADERMEIFDDLLDHLKTAAGLPGD